MTQNHKNELLTKIVRLVRERYYDPTFGGQDWNAVVDTHRQRIITARDSEAFEAEVAQILSVLSNSGHCGLLSPKTKIPPRNSINASLRRMDTPAGRNQWIFQDVLPGEVADRAGIRPGDILVAISGKVIDSTEGPAFPMDARTSILVDRAGTHHELHLDLTAQKPKYRSNPYSEPTTVARMGPNNIGILKIGLFPGFIGIDFANQVTHLLTTSLAKADRLLIDLRGNPGGGIGGLRVMSYLSPDSRPVGYSIDRKAAERGYRKEDLPRLNHIPRSKWEIPLLAVKFLTKKSVVLETEGLGKQRFHNRVGILVNEHSTGSSEMLAQFAKENGLATIIGKKTPGHLVSRSAFKIGHDYRLVLPVAAYQSWKGTRVEGNGIEPDVEADWSFEAAFEQQDPQLTTALKTVAAL
jgi:C-terminal processing protease CtpA/Prc